MEETNEEDRRIGLALSGGGVRAAAFHLGVLTRLAEEEKFIEDIKSISTVSGGSLIIGLLLAIYNNGINDISSIKDRSEEEDIKDKKFPKNDDFENIVKEAKKIFTNINLQLYFGIAPLTIGMSLALFVGFAKDYYVDLPDTERAFYTIVILVLTAIISRANLLSWLLNISWGINRTFTTKNLPSTPDWIINATSYKAGVRWRFTKEKIGDYKLGYDTQNKNFRLHKALAASAGFPFGVGKTRLFLPFGNYTKSEFNAVLKKEKEYIEYQLKKFFCQNAILKALSFFKPIILWFYDLGRNRRYLFATLWDGGIYDNNAMESYRRGKTSFKNINFLIVSDGSKYLKRSSFLEFPLGRIISIMMKQMRRHKRELFFDLIQDYANEDKNLTGFFVSTRDYPKYVEDQKTRLNQLIRNGLPEEKKGEFPDWEYKTWKLGTVEEEVESDECEEEKTEKFEIFKVKTISNDPPTMLVEEQYEEDLKMRGKEISLMGTSLYRLSKKKFDKIFQHGFDATNWYLHTNNHTKYKNQPWDEEMEIKYFPHEKSFITKKYGTLRSWINVRFNIAEKNEQT